MNVNELVVNLGRLLCQLHDFCHRLLLLPLDHRSFQVQSSMLLDLRRKCFSIADGSLLDSRFDKGVETFLETLLDNFDMTAHDSKHERSLATTCRQVVVNAAHLEELFDGWNVAPFAGVV